MTETPSLRSRLEKNLEEVRDRIARAKDRAGIRGEDPRLVVVTKYVESDVVRELIGLGIGDFGENRLQVAERKLSALSDLPITVVDMTNLADGTALDHSTFATSSTAIELLRHLRRSSALLGEYEGASITLGP